MLLAKRKLQLQTLGKKMDDKLIDLYYHLQPPDNLYFNFQSFLFPLPHPTPHTTTNQLANPIDS